MADNEIHVKVKVDDKGQLKSTGAKAKQAAGGVEDLNKAQDNYQKRAKGVAGATSNSTKAFSKMSMGTGGLVGAYATLAANIFAISAAYGFLKRAGDLVALQRGQDEYAVRTGLSMKLLTSRVQEATGGLLGFTEAAQATAIGSAAGLTSDQIEGLAKVAKNASVALGRDLTDSFNRLTRGAIKAEPELLDELGIIIRLDKVADDYARTLNKTAKELTTFEKSQAVVNAVLEQGNQKFADVGNNVNQIARLGKAFDDLVIKVQKAIEPLASFLGKALTDNIEGLAAAFTVLGLSIAKAMIPAGPAMANIANLAGASKKRLSAAAGTGTKAGANIGKGDFGAHELNQIEKSAQNASNKVIDYSKISKDQVKRDLLTIKADHAQTMAQNTMGVKRYTAQATAYLRGMQAQHGVIMGTMGAAWGGFAKLANKALNAIAILGLLYTAITLVKQLMKSMEDPAIQKLTDNANEVKDRFIEQNEEMNRLIEGYEKAGSLSSTIVKQANLLSNISYQNVEGLAQELKEINKEQTTIGMFGGDMLFGLIDSQGRHGGKGVTDEQIAIKGAIDSVIGSFEMQSRAFEEFGIDAEGFESKILTLKTALKNLDPAIVGKETEEQAAARYNEAVNVLKDTLLATTEEASRLNGQLAAPKAALTSISQMSEGYTKFSASLNHATSRYTTFLGFIDQAGQALKTQNKEGMTMNELFAGDTAGRARLAFFEKVLDLKLGEMTLEKVQVLLAEKAAGIREKEFEIERKISVIKRTSIKLQRGSSPLQIAQIKRTEKVLLLQQQQKVILQEIAIMEEAKASKDATAIAAAEEKVRLLQEQILSAAALNNEYKQIADSFKSGFEKSATGNIAALLKGEETSIKAAMLNIAQSAVGAVADKLAEQLSLNLTDFVFGKSKDPLETAVNTNVIALDKNTAALNGVPTTPGAAVTAGSASGPQQGGLLTNIGNTISDGFTKASNYLLGEKTTEVQLAQKGGGVVGLGTANADTTFRKGGVFTDFTNSLKDLFSGDAPFLEGIGNVFKDGVSGFGTLFKDFGGMFGDLLSGLFSGGGGGGGGFFSDLISIGSTFFTGAPTGKSGGIFSSGQKVQGYATGGIARGAQRGYPAVLHGTEAVVPLPNGRSIPVDMNNSSSSNMVNNITISIASDGTQSTRSNGPNANDNEDLGRAIALAVQEELQNQKRSGGILNPYGVA